MKKFITLIFLLFSEQHLCLAQNQHKIDSLQGELKKFEQEKRKLGSNAPALFDTTKGFILNYLSEEYGGINAGIAMDYAKQGLAIFEQLEFKKGIAYSYMNIGSVHNILCNFPEALKYELAALKKSEEIGYKLGIANVYLNMSAVNGQQGKYDEALKNCFSGLKISKEIGFTKGIILCYNNLGVIYTYLNNYPEALKNYHSALMINQEFGDTASMGLALSNVGYVYYAEGKYDEALKNYFEAGKMFEKVASIVNIPNNYNNIGSTYEKKGNLREALRYTTKALVSARDAGLPWETREAYKGLASIDSGMGNFKSAFENQKLYMFTNDSMFNMEKDKKLTTLQMQYDFDKKESSTRAEQDKKDIMQRNIRNSITGGALFLLALLLLLIHRYRFKQKANKQLKEAFDNLKSTQQQLIQSEKMAAFGVMAQRVAHEIQNPLNFVNNFSEISEELAQEIVTEGSHEEKKELAQRLLMNVQKINEHGKRASTIVKQLQKHSRAGTAHEFFEENEK